MWSPTRPGEYHYEAIDNNEGLAVEWEAPSAQVWLCTWPVDGVPFHTKSFSPVRPCRGHQGYPCLQYLINSNCVWCPQLQKSNEIVSTAGQTTTGPSNIINKTIWYTSWVVCNTTSDIRSKQLYPVNRHFNENDNHKDATFQAQILRLIKWHQTKTTSIRKHKENWWIHTMKTFQPNLRLRPMIQ